MLKKMSPETLLKILEETPEGLAIIADEVKAEKQEQLERQKKGSARS